MKLGNIGVLLTPVAKPTRGYSVSLTFYLSFTRTSFTFSTLPKEFTSQPLTKNNKLLEGLVTVFNPR